MGSSDKPPFLSWLEVPLKTCVLQSVDMTEHVANCHLLGILLCMPPRIIAWPGFKILVESGSFASNDLPLLGQERRIMSPIAEVCSIVAP